MKSYEGYFVLPPDATIDMRKNQIKALEEMVKKFQGRVIQKTELGRRFLGYPVRKFKEGYAVVVDFESEPKEQDAFRKALDLHEDVIKYMITIKEIPRQKPEPARPVVAAAPKFTPKKFQEQVPSS